MALRLDPFDFPTDEGPRQSRSKGRSAFIGIALILLGSVGGWALARQQSGLSITELKPGPPEQEEVLIISPSAQTINSAPATPEGAVTAATGFMTYYAELLDKSNQSQSEFLKAVLSPTAAPDFVASLDQQLSEAKRRLADVPVEQRGYATLVPITYNVTDSFSPEHATVKVWAALVAAGGPEGLSHVTWFFSEVSLDRVNDEWRVSAWATSAGPTPTTDTPVEDAATSSDLVSVFRDFSEYRHATAGEGSQTN